MSANNIPLGEKRLSSKSSSSSLLKPSYLQDGGSQSDANGVAPPLPITHQTESDRKRLASEAIEAAKAAAALAADKMERKRKRKSRWADAESDKTFIPGMPTMLPHGLSQAQEEAYLLQLKIEDTSRRLRSGDLGIPLNPEDRSPSPEPIYSSDGKRLNTRDYRKRKELEETRHDAITRIIELNAVYKPPPDYKPPQIKVSDKVMIPQDDHPDINFVGLLIGPRGNTLKSMERDTGAKIIIRGKGSVKEGKVGRKDGQPLPGEDEPLHAYITATNPDAVRKAVDKIKEIIRQGVDVPEGQNDLRKNQLRELALLNGTLREGDGLRCTNCGAADHKAWQCQDKTNVTNNVVCTGCGGVGHISKDCVQKRPGMGGFDNPGQNKMDDEYMSLMAELGEGPAPDKSYQEGRITRGPTKQLPYQSVVRPPPRPLMSGPRPPAQSPTSNEYETSSNYGYGGPSPTGGNAQPTPPHGEGWNNKSGAGGPPSWQQSGGTPPRWMGPGGQRPPPPPPPPGMQPPNWGNEGKNPPNFPNFFSPPPPPPPSGSGSSGPPPGGSPQNWPPWGAPPPPPGQGPVPPPRVPNYFFSPPPPPPPPPGTINR